MQHNNLNSIIANCDRLCDKIHNAKKKRNCVNAIKNRKAKIIEKQRTNKYVKFGLILININLIHTLLKVLMKYFRIRFKIHLI
jgi:hypothetical protein